MECGVIVLRLDVRSGCAGKTLRYLQSNDGGMRPE